MAIWIDDLLTDQDKYLDLSVQARACLIETWCYVKRSKTDGLIRVERLHKASDQFSPQVKAELIAAGWWHEGGRGCGDDTCPKGVEGYVVMHDWLDHQESANDASARVQKSREKKRQDALRREEFNATHTAIRDDKGRIVKWVPNDEAHTNPQ